MVRNEAEEPPDEPVKPLSETSLIVLSYLAGVRSIVDSTARDPSYRDNHLLSYLAQDFLQSAISLTTLGAEGLISVAKRELRFIIEASIKLCFVQQKDYNSSITEKLKRFDKELSSQRISIKQNLNLAILPEGLREPFIEEVGRLYGLTSTYVHLTPEQLQERIASVDAGRTAGRESPEDIEKLNLLISRGLSASLILLFHSVPAYVAGDCLVEADGSTAKWYFCASQFIAGLDSEFDYKHERNERLAEIRAARQAAIRF